MAAHSSLSSASWYLKYIGLPLTVGATMYGLSCCYNQMRRRAELEGKVVVITGASSGIGEALAHEFYQYGSKVVLAARRETELNRVKQDLLAKNVIGSTQEPVVIPLDLGDLSSVEAFVKQVYHACGQVDILVNNGGISFRGAIIDTKIDIDQKIMNINYFGAVALTKALLPQMVGRKSGHVVFVSSVQGLIAIPDRAVYAASKHAMQAFGDCLRAEMKQHNVNVTVISPGYVKTAVSENALTPSGGHHGVMDSTHVVGFIPEYVAKKMIDAIISKKKDFIISQFTPNLAIFLRHAAPGLYHRIMARRANKTG